MLLKLLGTIIVAIGEHFGALHGAGLVRLCRYAKIAIGYDDGILSFVGSILPPISSARVITATSAHSGPRVQPRILSWTSW
jgi:hypothetical protein